MKPTFVLLAGPNGSGKSSLAGLEIFKSLNLKMINPDECAKLAPPGANALIWSGREVRRLIGDAIAYQQSFSVETTLSGNNHNRTIADCRAAGYLVEMHFVFVRTIEAAKERVKTRVLEGGHDVPEPDQERRYGRSIENGIELSKSVDAAYFYDNSFRGGHKLAAHFEMGSCKFVAEFAPGWLRGAIDQ